MLSFQTIQQIEPPGTRPSGIRKSFNWPCKSPIFQTEAVLNSTLLMALFLRSVFWARN